MPMAERFLLALVLLAMTACASTQQASTVVRSGFLDDYSILQKGAEELEALLFLAEPGSAWTLIYPACTVVVPLPNPINIPVVYPMPKKDQLLIDFVNA